MSTSVCYKRTSMNGIGKKEQVNRVSQRRRMGLVIQTQGLGSCRHTIWVYTKRSMKPHEFKQWDYTPLWDKKSLCRKLKEPSIWLALYEERNPSFLPLPH